MNEDSFKISFQDAKMIKTIAIVLVITGHLGITKIGMWDSGTLGVALFLILSGYGLHESYRKNGLKDFWRKRLSKVYMPYIIVMIIEIAIDYLCLKKSYTLIQIVGIFFGRGEVLDGTMWYIFYLLLFYIAFWTIYKIAKGDSYICIGGLIVFGIFLALLWLLRIYDTPVLSGIYFPFFAIGCLISKLSDANENYKKIIICIHENKNIYGILVGGLSLVTVILIYSSNVRFGRIAGIMSATLSSYFMVLIVIGYVILKQSDRKYYTLLSKVGEYSYYLYLLEGVLLVKYTLAFEFVKNYYISLTIYLLFLFVGSIVLKGLVEVFEKKLLLGEDK